MIRCMDVDEAGRVCKDRTRWRSVVSAYLHGKRREFIYLYLSTASDRISTFKLYKLGMFLVVS